MTIDTRVATETMVAKIEEIRQLATEASLIERSAAKTSFQLFSRAADLLTELRVVYPFSEETIRSFVHAHLKTCAIIGPVSASRNSWGRFASKCESTFVSNC